MERHEGFYISAGMFLINRCTEQLQGLASETFEHFQLHNNIHDKKMLLSQGHIKVLKGKVGLWEV